MSVREYVENFIGLVCLISLVYGVYFLLLRTGNPSEEDIRQGQIEEDKNRSEEERKEKESKRITDEMNQRVLREKLLQGILSKLRGSWFGNNQDGLVEIVFEDEKRLTIIRNQTDVISLHYRIISIDEEILLEVDYEGRVSEVNLRFMKDGSGRIHFKSDNLEMVLVKK